jgi:hypothetical protein
LPFFVRLDHTNATVLYLKPHAFITSNASGKRGDTAHKNKTQLSSATPPNV